MNVGDMVTLSAAAKKRDPMSPWSDRATIGGYGKPKPIGIVVEVREDSKIGWNSREQSVYVIRWITAGAPVSREAQWGYYADKCANQFYRVDLKFVSRRKRRKK